MHFVGNLGAIFGELTVGWISSFAFAQDAHVWTGVSILVWQGHRGKRKSQPRTALFNLSALEVHGVDRS